MALFNWSEKYKVKINSIDEQHQQLFKYMNDLHEAIVNKEEEKIMAGIVDGLIKYANIHLDYEEKLFEKHDYPAQVGHTREHDEFRNKASDMKKSFDEGSEVDALDVLAFMVDWLQGHILASDMKYTNFFIEKGVT